MKIDVKSIVEKRKKELKEQAQECNKLLIIQVGDNPSSNAYIKGKMKDCEEIGIESTLIKYSEGVSACTIVEDLKKIKKRYNGIILQEPAHISEDYLFSKRDILKEISSKRDVDGFLPDSNFKPCTPLGIMNLLEEIRGTDNLRGVVVTVVGRGKLVGRPLIPMLNDAGATVISCNSATPNIGDMTRHADIVITAVGKKNLITRDMLKNNAIVIDAGIVVDENGKLSGDCDKKLYEDLDVMVTPVPGGVGLMTRVTLLENLIKGH